MSFLSSMNICASGLTAQRTRLDIASENITNIQNTRTESGGPYRRKMVVFQAMDGNAGFKGKLNQAMGKNTNAGVRVTGVVEDQRPFKTVYNPDHPDANEEGYVEMPNVDLLKETVDSMEASRAYDANLTALNAIKLMASKALEIGR